MHCNALQCTTTYYNALLRGKHCVLVDDLIQTHCTTLHQIAMRYNARHHPAILCNTLQHTATHCNTLQNTALHCDILQHTVTLCNTLQRTATHCNTLQHTATHCNARQHSATHCNTLQQGKHCVLVDDLIQTGTSPQKSALPSPCIRYSIFFYFIQALLPAYETGKS